MTRASNEKPTHLIAVLKREEPMRIVIMAIATIMVATVAARAAETPQAAGPSQIAVPLPDTADNLKVYLFQLKKNGISVKDTPERFCSHMGYGKAVLAQPDEEIGDDRKVIIKGIDWVICEFKQK